MCKNVRSLADDLQVVRECQRHQSQVTHFKPRIKAPSSHPSSSLPSPSTHTPLLIYYSVALPSQSKRCMKSLKVVLTFECVVRML